MSRMSIALAFVAGATILVASAAKGPSLASAAPTPAMSESYWRCPSGYTFAMSSNAVHCKKASWTETKALMPCVLATPTLKIDLLNSTDMCAGSVGVTVTAEPVCYPTDMAAGFTKRYVSGKDFCGKTHPAEVIAPNQRITL